MLSYAKPGTGLFAPKTIRSRERVVELSLPGTFAPWYFLSEQKMELKYAAGKLANRARNGSSNCPIPCA